MKDITGTIEEMLIEMTFAEGRNSGAQKNISGRCTDLLDNLYTGITFFEAGEVDTAQKIMGGSSNSGRSSVEYFLPGFFAGRA